MRATATDPPGLFSLLTGQNRAQELWAQVCSTWRGTASIAELQSTSGPAVGVPNRSPPEAGRTLSSGSQIWGRAGCAEPSGGSRHLKSGVINTWSLFRLPQWEVCEGIGNQHYQVKKCFCNLKILRNISSLFSTPSLYAQNVSLMSISSSLTVFYAEVCSCLETHKESAEEQENGNKCKADWLLQMLQKM